MMFSVGNHLDVDLVLELSIGTVGSSKPYSAEPAGCRVAAKQATAAEMPGFLAPGLALGTVSTSSIGIPIMDNRKKYPH